MLVERSCGQRDRAAFGLHRRWQIAIESIAHTQPYVSYRYIIGRTQTRGFSPAGGCFLALPSKKTTTKKKRTMLPQANDAMCVRPI